MSGEDQETAETVETTPAVRAFACLGAVSIAYSWSGSGRPLLLMVPGFALRERLREQLARRFRVVAPEIGARLGAIRGSLWLPDLIEALGLARPHLVAAGPRALEALQFGVTEPDQVGRVAILWRDPAGSARTGAAPEDCEADPSRHLMVLRLATATPEGPIRQVEIEALDRFLQ